MKPIKLPNRAIDITGQKFGLLTVLYPATHENRNVMWECQCECGNTCRRVSHALKRSGHASCGCEDSRSGFADRTRTHGMRHTSEYNIWNAMKHRCYNENVIAYPSYGGRGITICDRWLESFQNFYSDMGPRPNGLSIDRIDNDGNYCPENCKWSTPLEQAQNRRVRKDSIKHQTASEDDPQTSRHQDQ